MSLLLGCFSSKRRGKSFISRVQTRKHNPFKEQPALYEEFNVLSQDTEYTHEHVIVPLRSYKSRARPRAAKREITLLKYCSLRNSRPVIAVHTALTDMEKMVINQDAHATDLVVPLVKSKGWEVLDPVCVLLMLEHNRIDLIGDLLTLIHATPDIDHPHVYSFVACIIHSMYLKNKAQTAVCDVSLWGRVIASHRFRRVLLALFKAGDVPEHFVSLNDAYTRTVLNYVDRLIHRKTDAQAKDILLFPAQVRDAQTLLTFYTVCFLQSYTEHIKMITDSRLCMNNEFIARLGTTEYTRLVRVQEHLEHYYGAFGLPASDTEVTKKIVCTLSSIRRGLLNKYYNNY